MKTIELVFGTYNGLPLGSTDVEFENAYQRAYKPFLTTLYKHPTVTSTIYYSGILLTWLYEHHPEFLMLLNDMVKRNQIELLGGAFYEPILPIIPASDRSGQIEMLTTFLRKRFGKRPRGIWIPELTWEPSLPVTLNSCGMEYSFLDSSSFDAAGIPARNQYRPVKTEDQGKTLEIYPVLSRLAPSALSGAERDDPTQYVKRIISGCPSDENAIVTVIEQGESLGLWENSHTWLYGENGWLAGLFAELGKSDCAIETILPKENTRRPHRAERCYFGCSRADSLTHWWYDADAAKKDLGRTIRQRVKQLLPSGSFRQIIKRYPESTNLYSKMMHVFVLVNQIRGDRYRKRAAREELWKGQSGYAFWHGRNDGIHRNGIRKSAYTALIEAEKIARERGVFRAYTSREDFDMDGLEEYLFIGNQVNVYIHLAGGAVFELDYLPKSWNYLDTMSRYEEPYHGVLIPESAYDLVPRRSFFERIVPESLTLKDFQHGSHQIEDDLACHVYEVTDYKRDHMEVGLKTQWLDRLDIEKTYRLSKDFLTVDYTIINRGDEPIVGLSLLIELNLSFASNNEEFLQLRANAAGNEVLTLRDASESRDVSSLEARDLKNAVSIDVTLSRACDLWNLPILSHWFSRSGSRSGYQSSSFVLKLPISLDPGATSDFSAKLGIKG